MRKKSKTEEEILKAVLDVKAQFASDLEEIIDQYCLEFIEKKQRNLKILCPLDILGVLELVKLNYFCSSKNRIIDRRKLQNQNMEDDHDCDFSYH